MHIATTSNIPRELGSRGPRDWRLVRQQSSEVSWLSKSALCSHSAKRNNTPVRIYINTDTGETMSFTVSGDSGNRVVEKLHTELRISLWTAVCVFWDLTLTAIIRFAALFTDCLYLMVLSIYLVMGYWDAVQSTCLLGNASCAFIDASSCHLYWWTGQYIATATFSNHWSVTWNGCYVSMGCELLSMS